MNSKVQKCGKNLAVQIPKSFAKEAHLDEGSTVTVMVQGGKLIVDPKPAQKLSLDKLLKKVTKKNLHPEVDSGKPVGREVW